MAQINAVIEGRSRRAIEALSKRAHIAAAYLFGSRVDGTDDRWSDIDLAVFPDDLEGWDLRARARASAFVQKEAGDDIEIHFFSADALRSPDPASFASHILAHGIRIATID